MASLKIKGLRASALGKSLMMYTSKAIVVHTKFISIDTTSGCPLLNSLLHLEGPLCFGNVSAIIVMDHYGQIRLFLIMR